MLCLRNNQRLTSSEHHFTPANEPWDNIAERIPGVIRFDWDTVPYLATILGRFKLRDPYMACPAYHAFTGRKGLWGYAKGHSLLLFARNPDKPQQIMFFPQLGNQFPNLAFELIQKVPVPIEGYQFSRIEAERADFLAASLNRRSSEFDFRVETESLLDWTYPVRIISTEAVQNPTGNRFKNFRQPINIFPKEKIRIEPIDPEKDSKELISVIESWARSKREISSPDELIGTYVSFLELMRHPGLDLQGIKFYYDGELTAFEAWSMPPEGGKTASNLAGFNKSDARGFSEYQHYSLCKILYSQGIERICLGGSESAGLDFFKLKMNPVESVELATITLKPLKNMMKSA